MTVSVIVVVFMMVVERRGHRQGSSGRADAGRLRRGLDAMIVIVVMSTMFVVVMVIVRGERFFDGTPDGDGADQHQYQEHDAAEQNPNVKLIVDEPQFAALPKHDRYAAECAAHGDREKLVQVIGVAVAVRMLVSHETNLSANPQLAGGG
jgi:hypothetical protein